MAACPPTNDAACPSTGVPALTNAEETLSISAKADIVRHGSWGWNHHPSSNTLAILTVSAQQEAVADAFDFLPGRGVLGSAL